MHFTEFEYYIFLFVTCGCKSWILILNGDDIAFILIKVRIIQTNIEKLKKYFG